MRKVVTCVLAGAVAVLLVGIEAKALINPNFTPIQLVDQADLILVLKLSKPDAKGIVTATIEKTVKGKPEGKTLIIDLSAPGKDREAVTEAVVKRVKANGDRPALFFAGEFQEEGGQGGFGQQLAGGFVHIAGKWHSLWREKDGSWGLDEITSHMEGTWAGGTDMLLRCINYIKANADGDPDIPVASGASWDAQKKITTVPGKVSSVMAVDLAGDGTAFLHLASDAGDRLFARDAKKKAFQDITSARNMKARSRAAVWADLTGDGRLDLASWDGKALTLWRQGADGAFSPRRVDLGDAAAGGCLGLAVVDVGVKGKPGLLLSTPGAPILLRPGNPGSFKPKALTKKSLPVNDLGKPAACVVADLDGDGVADVLQPFEKGSLLYKGTGVGAFADPVRGNVAVGVLPAVVRVADFDHDGLLDVFVAAEDFCKIYQNLGGGQFANRMGISGEIAYISQHGARGAQVCDVNNDGRQDVFIWYSHMGPHLFFNRGFRSFGHAHSLDLAERTRLGEKDLAGQQAGLVADLNGDGAQDMVIVVPSGDVWVFYRAIYLESALVAHVMLPPGGDFAGPLTVTGWTESRPLGAWNVVAGSSNAFIAQMEAGPIELRWQFPGGKPQKREIILESGPVREVLKPGK